MTLFKENYIVIVLVGLMCLINAEDVDIDAIFLKGFKDFFKSYDASNLNRDITDYEFAGGEYIYDICHCKMIFSLEPFGEIFYFNAYWPTVSMDITGFNDTISDQYLSGNWVIRVTVTELWAYNTYLLYNPLLFRFTDAKLYPTVETIVFSVISSDKDLSVEIGNLNTNAAAKFNANSVEIGKAIAYYIVNDYYGSGVSPLTIPGFFVKCISNKECDQD